MLVPSVRLKVNKYTVVEGEVTLLLMDRVPTANVSNKLGLFLSYVPNFPGIELRKNLYIFTGVYFVNNWLS